jgi:predicted nucleic acid-binding protein
MVLVDTSVLIDYLRGTNNEATRSFQYILDKTIVFGINSFIYLEVLQGVKTDKDYQTVKSYLDTQKFYRLRDEKESFSDAARIYFYCRKKGITINSTVDCLIAQTAIENELMLLHNDSDFEKMRKVVSLAMFHAPA